MQRAAVGADVQVPAPGEAAPAAVSQTSCVAGLEGPSGSLAGTALRCVGGLPWNHPMMGGCGLWGQVGAP